jgi:NodT family efflux transporter outer membrane factor (OMF) lipoprotein
MSEQHPVIPIGGTQRRPLPGWIRSFAAHALAPLLLGLLAACTLVPTYRRPDTPMAQSWDGAAQVSLADAVAVRSAWWRNYQDPQLDALVERSLQNNFSLASAVASVNLARANAERAGAPLYPTVSLGGTFARTHQRTNYSGSNSSSSSSNGQSLFAEASYEIDFWGLNSANANAARLLARASEFDRATVALTLTASVTDTYFQVQSLRQRLMLARAIERDAGRILELLLAQQQAGIATQLQVEQQRNVLATFQAAVPTLQQQLEQSMHLLATLVGVAPEQFVLGEAQIDDIPIPQPLPNLPATLLETRPDIRSKEAQLQSENYSVGAARAAFLPNLVLTADGGLSSSALTRFLSSPFSSLAATLSAPLLDGGALRGQLHANQAGFAKGIADYRQTVVSALQDVEDSLSAQQQQALAETAERVAADAAAKAAVLAQAQYQSGTIDFLSVLDAQRTLYQAQDTLAQARLQRLQASVSLFRAFGGGAGVTADTPMPVAAISSSVSH